jgi:hypothetical protein
LKKSVSRQTHRAFHEGFTCLNCGMFVSCLSDLSGVQNRNHCPFCLYSRHLDAHQGGDRRSACQALMKPIALSFKPSRNKYAREHDGELQLVHRCVRCRKVVLNRIAADDNSALIMQLFELSCQEHERLTKQLRLHAIQVAQHHDAEIVKRTLFGRSVFEANEAELV